MTIKLMKENVNRTKHSYLLGAGFEVGEDLPQPRLTQEKQVKTVRVPFSLPRPFFSSPARCLWVGRDRSHSHPTGETRSNSTSLEIPSCTHELQQPSKHLKQRSGSPTSAHMSTLNKRANSLCSRLGRKQLNTAALSNGRTCVSKLQTNTA